MDEYALVDNVFCTAILQILESSDYLTDSPTFDWDEVRSDFEQNGTGDETFNGTTNCASKRKPLANLQTKVNRRIPKKALKKQQNNTCRFCENNEEPEDVYKSHTLRDTLGRVTCPRLRQYVCPICGASGDNAHTVRYCTMKPIYVIEEGEVTSVKKLRSRKLFTKAIRL